MYIDNINMLKKHMLRYFDIFIVIKTLSVYFSSQNKESENIYKLIFFLLY